MARQNTTPVTFQRSSRSDSCITMTSGKAGVVIPLGYAVVNRGDSAAGRVSFDLELAEMPKPMLNGVVANFQAWFVPKNAHPQFAGSDEFMHSYQGDTIKALGQPDREPPAFYSSVVLDSDDIDKTILDQSEFFRTLGLHIPPTGADTQLDLLDAFSLIYNFRTAAHSSKLPLRAYAADDLAEATTFPPAFWPSSSMSNIVPDYEQALVIGSLDLDVQQGLIPVQGIGRGGTIDGVGPNASFSDTARGTVAVDHATSSQAANRHPIMELDGPDGMPMIFAEMAGETVVTSLADIDKARVTQAFANLRTSYAGNDTTGFGNDDTIVATLMQGLQVPQDQFRRPWLLDSARVPIGFAQRYATDSANLDVSVSQGATSATLSMNLPAQDSGGVIIYTVELLPERILERQSDEWLHITSPDGLPDALRDVQRVEPVDWVPNRRVDARHTQPDGLYGYEPMNDQWNRNKTRLGGIFYQDDPSNPYVESRSALWMTSIVDPTYGEDHYLAPVPFPHDVFSDTTAPAFEVVARHTLSIVGLTQFGDVLHEDNNEYADTEAEAGVIDPGPGPVTPG